MRGMRGAGPLLRLAWRRDRVMIVVTCVVVWVLTYFSVVATEDLYATEEQRRMANAEAAVNPGVVAMYGPIHDVDSIGGIGSSKLAMLNFLVLTFLVVAIVRRHTRAEEEAGRTELLGAAPVGRRAPLATAVLLAVIVSVVTGLVTGALAALAGWPTGGSMLLGLALVGVGLSFTGIAAVAAQLSTSNRVTGFWVFGALALAFVLRMVGDLQHGRPAGVLSWLSPLGWGQQARPFDGDRWWALVIPPLFLLATLALAAALRARRDLGAGLLPDRRGRPTGRLSTAGGLARRLQLPSLVGWLVGFVALGAVLGAVVGTIGGFLTPQAEDLLRRMGGVGGATEIYLTMVGGIAALAATAFGIGAVLRLRSEESAGHLEQVLATRVTRSRQFVAHTAIALVGASVLVAATSLTMATTHALAVGGTDFAGEATAGMAQLPAIWVMVALAAFVVAWLPRLDWLGWGLFSGVLLLTELGGLLGLPEAVQKISPFAHVPRLPVEPMEWTPEVVLTVVAAVLLVAALVGYRRRDMPVA